MGRTFEAEIAGNPVLVIDIDQFDRESCPTCGEGCCDLSIDDVCPGGCEHGVIHYLEQFRTEDRRPPPGEVAR